MDGLKLRVFSLLAATLGVIALIAVMAPAAAFAEEPRCAVQSDGKKWCATLSTTYPEMKGWYAWIGLPGGPCNGGPLENWYTGDLVGACVVPPPQTVWQWKNGAWVKASLPVGTKGYVHPYAADWRWVYTEELGWTAVRADRMYLRYSKS